MQRFLFLSLFLLVGCSRHDVGDEKNNPAPSSNYSLAAVQNGPLVAAWINLDPVNHRWSTPTPTSSMVPYLDSHSVLLLEAVQTPVRVHDILVMDEGPGRRDVCHQVTDIKGDYLYIEGKNNQYPDGWVLRSAVKWRVAATLYTSG